MGVCCEVQHCRHAALPLLRRCPDHHGVAAVIVPIPVAPAQTPPTATGSSGGTFSSPLVPRRNTRRVRICDAPGCLACTAGPSRYCYQHMSNK